MQFAKDHLLRSVGICLLAMTQPAFAQDNVEVADFLIWNNTVGFSPNETVEILIEQTEAPVGPDTMFNFEVTNDNGIVIGSIKATIPGRDPQDSGRSRGFGFVTMELSASPDEKLLINDELFGFLTVSPRTGRYAVGISLFSSKKPDSDGSNVPLGGATVTIVGTDGGTAAVEFILGRPGQFQSTFSSD